MLLRYLLVAAILFLGLGRSAYAVPVLTTDSYVGAGYTYQPAGQFSYNGNTHPLHGDRLRRNFG
jgi:hypothetical protein